MLNEKMIKGLEEKGFKRWTKGNMDRLYINAETALDFEYDTNKSGHVSGAYLNGERISNSRGAALVNSKTYVDVATGELVSNHDMMRDAAQEIMDTVAEEIEAAEASENTKTAEIIEGRALTEDQIRFLEYVGLELNNDETMLVMDTTATGLNPLMGLSTVFRGEKISYERALELYNSTTWIDVENGEIHSEFDVMRECAEEMIDKANAMIREQNEEDRETV